MLTARHAVVICTGSRAALPDLPGIAEARPWTNRKATDSSSVPNRLAVVGAGGVGIEMATTWRGLGASVTLLARGSGLLPRMESFVGEYVERGLREAGVVVRVGVSVAKLRRPDPDGPVTLDFKGLAAGAVYQHEAHHVLPPGGCCVAVRDRQIDMRESLKFGHTVIPILKARHRAHHG